MTTLAQNLRLVTNNSQLAPKHWQEWLESAVDPEIIKLNVESLTGDEAADAVLYSDKIERTNTGRLCSSYLRKYAHLERGGWWCAGIDLLTGDDSLWGCLKPDFPRTSKEGKIIKYEHPAKVATEVFALRVPDAKWEVIASRYKVSVEAEDKTFWQWVKNHSEIPVLITEGAKKAASLLSAGYVAIALPGIYNGYRQEKTESGEKIGLPSLIPQLEVFAQKGREISFVFDNDTKLATIKNVITATIKTGNLFKFKGCDVSVVRWEYPEKGVDDLIAARGKDCFEQAFKARISLDELQLEPLLDISKYNPLQLNSRYLGESLIPPADAKIIALKSPKNTGKTQWMTREIGKAIDAGQRVLVITHRIQLARSLAFVFGVDHIDEIHESETGGILGYALCIDSLRTNGKAAYKAREWEDAVVVIDECEQFVWHMLDAATEIKKHRCEVISNFRELLQTVVGSEKGKVYLADADLSTIAIDYTHQLIGFPVKTWVVENIIKPYEGKRQVVVYQDADPGVMMQKCMDAIESGEKPFIAVGGQKESSTWGTINLEKLIKDRFPGLKTLRIDSESVSDPNHPAYGCISKINEIVVSYDVLIASPVLETGVSIDVKSHFTSVWGINFGLQTVDAVAQALERVREDVPRHVWVAEKTAMGLVGNGSINTNELVKTADKLSGFLFQLYRADFEGFEVNNMQPSMFTWAKRACLVNAGKRAYRQLLVKKLAADGYEVILNGDNEDDYSIKDEAIEIKKESYTEYCQAVADAPMPTSEQLDALRDKRNKTKAEQYQECKGNLYHRYGQTVTEELVKRDDNGWYSQLQLHYYLTVGKEYLEDRDRSVIQNYRENNQKEIFAPDLNNSMLAQKIKTLEALEVMQFVGTDKQFTNENLKDWHEKILKLKADIKRVLNVSISLDSPIRSAQSLLKLLGLQMVGKRVRTDAGLVRVYPGADNNPDNRILVLSEWRARDIKKREKPEVYEQQSLELVPPSEENFVPPISDNNNILLGNMWNNTDSTVEPSPDKEYSPIESETWSESEVEDFTQQMTANEAWLIACQQYDAPDDEWDYNEVKALADKILLGNL